MTTLTSPSSYGARADLERMLAAEIRRLASMAGVVEPRLELVADSPKVASVERRRDGMHLMLRQELLAAPPAVLSGLLAHEVAHIVRQDPKIRRRLRLGSVAAIWVIAMAVMTVSTLLILNGHDRLAAVAVLAGLAGLFLPRSVHLVVIRRQEFQADRLAARLLGGTEPVVAFLDWASAHLRPLREPLPVRLWKATHPSNAARRTALLEWVGEQETKAH